MQGRLALVLPKPRPSLVLEQDLQHRGVAVPRRTVQRRLSPVVANRRGHAAHLHEVLDRRHIADIYGEKREIAHASLHVDPVVRIGSSSFAESGITVDAMGLGFQRRHYPADNHAPGDFERSVPATHSEVLRYLAYDAPWPAPVGV